MDSYKELLANPNIYPKDWVNDSSLKVITYNVNKETDEYKRIYDMILKPDTLNLSIKDGKIIADDNIDIIKYKNIIIERIENPRTYIKYYINLCDVAERNNSTIEATECLLYHYTYQEYIPHIILENLDPRLAKDNEAFGKGIYLSTSFHSINRFATKQGYTGSIRKVLICRAIIGNTTASKKMFTRPPYKNKDIDIIMDGDRKIYNDCIKLYDSTIGVTEGSMIYISFDQYYTYPAYIVTYEIDE